MTSLLHRTPAPGRRRALSPLVLAAAILGAAYPLAARSEPPLAPGAPAVGRVVGAPNSLGVRWTAPDNTGRPAIESYDVQYRTRTEPWWSMPPRNVTDTATPITHLLRNTTLRGAGAGEERRWRRSLVGIGVGNDGKEHGTVIRRHLHHPHAWPRTPSLGRPSEARRRPRTPIRATR